LPASEFLLPNGILNAQVCDAMDAASRICGWRQKQYRPFRALVSVRSSSFTGLHPVLQTGKPFGLESLISQLKSCCREVRLAF
jgi:hypothetical protein